jgi:hypothetical protein
MSNKEEANKLGYELEKEDGTSVFLKVCMSACSRLLVEKGIATEEELRQSFIDEVKRHNETLP